MNLAAHVLAQRFAAPALICGAEELTRDELARRVARAAGALRALGVQPGERVLFVMRDTPQFAAAWLGAVHAGAVAVALNGRLSEVDYRHVLADSGARLAFVEREFDTARAALEPLCADAARLGDGPEIAAFQTEPEAPAFCLYSSGTTGLPKGIVHAHRVALSLGEAFRMLRLREGERVFTTSKLFFAYGLEHGLLAPLATGVTSILTAEWPEPQTVLDTAARHQPQAIFSVPTLYRRLVSESPAHLAPLRAVRYFVAAGESLSPQLVSQWHAAVGSELLNLYGTSEAFCACMMTPPGTSDGVRTGKPFAVTELRLRDAEGREPPRGEPGVLWLRHPALARGYLHLPEATHSQFQDGWFCSRDLFVLDAQGFYVHHGRTDELIKVAGQWVSPLELEEAALAHTGVAEAACVSVNDGDGLQRLALFVTGNENAARAAQAACERLPRHKRPKWIRAVEELPRTATGKVQRYKLREMLERELNG
jgi:acyl-coenzyme A synthetase/AMP-(fatty) acid ligase